MNATGAFSGLPTLRRRGLTESENNLVTLLHTNAFWIWTAEDPETMTVPTAPANVQRAFRKSFPLRAQSKPENVTIVVAADDYFAMYVDGVLVQAAEPSHNCQDIVAYNVPLPVVKDNNSSSDSAGQDAAPSLVLGFRVINKMDHAGLLVAVQVNYPAPQAPDQFFTGTDDDPWLGEPLFQEHWEQPGFDLTREGSSWRPALVRTAEEMSPDFPTLGTQDIAVMGALEGATGNIVPPQVPTPTPTPTPAPTPSAGVLCASESTGCSGRVVLTKGGFAGALVGTALAAFVVAAVIAFLLARRRYRYRRKVQRGDHSGEEVLGGVAGRPQVEEVQLATNPRGTLYEWPVVLG